MDIGNWLSRLRSELSQTSESPSLDAQVLLSHVLQRDRAWLLAHHEFLLTPDQDRQVEAAGRRLTAGVPLPYVIGRWEFWGRSFQVTPDVLIPRPETELLVEQAVSWLRAHPERRQAADIGTGSGCIAISLAAELPDLRVLASDISAPALQVAQENARIHQVASRIRFVQCDLLPESRQLSGPDHIVHPSEGLAAESRFDMICANLPYIPTATLQGLEVHRREPTVALDGGPDGLVQIRRLLALAPGWLAPGGQVLVEIEASQAGQVERLAGRFFPAAALERMQDLAGRDRLLRIQAP